MCALRSSRASSASSLSSKFASMAKSAASYALSDKDYQYQQGQITPVEYLKFLDGQLGKSASGTSSYLSLVKKVNSVTLDKQQNEVDAQISQGKADPAEMVPILQQRIIDENIQEGTPLYNQIQGSIMSYNDRSVDYKKSAVYNAYQALREQDAGAADKQWEDYLATLPNQYMNERNIATAQSNYDEFKVQRVKNDVGRSINQTELSLLANGSDTLAKKAMMSKVYGELYQKAVEAGLPEFADSLLAKQYSANDAYTNALAAAAKKDKTAEIKNINDQIRQQNIALGNIRPTDVQPYQDAMMAKVNLLFAKQAAVSDDPTQLAVVNDQLDSLGFASSDMKTANGIEVKAGEYIGNKDPMDILNKVQNGMADPALKNQWAAQNQFDSKNPQNDSYILTYDKGKWEFKQITLKNLSANGADITFEGEKTGNVTPGSDVPPTNYVYDPNDNVYYKITFSTKDDGTHLYYIDKPGYDANGQPKKESVDFNGDAPVILGKEISNGIFRKEKADGGFDFYQTDRKNSVKPVTIEEATKLSAQPVDVLLEGSKSAVDQKIVESTGSLRKELNALNPDNPNVSKIKALIDNAKADEAQKALEKAKTESMMVKPAAPAGGLPTPLDQLPVSKPQASAPNIVPGNTGTYISPTEAIAATKPKPISAVAKAAGKPVDPGNFAALGAIQEIAPGYYRRLKADGGFDFVKGNPGAVTGGNISAEDLAKETRTIVDKVKDPNATKFSLL